jgi:hypothetical protein
MARRGGAYTRRSMNMQRIARRQKAIRTPKAAAIAGTVFALLLGTAMVLLWIAIPVESRRSGDWIMDDSSRDLVEVALHMLPFAGIAFLWFIGVIRDRLGENEDRFFATVFLGSGLLFVAMIFSAGAVAGGLVVSADNISVPEPPVWSYGGRVTYGLIAIYAMRMAGVFMISTTTLSMRLQIVPKWLAIAGYLGAAVLLLTTGRFPYVAIIFPAWVLVLSVHLLVTTLRQGSDVTEAAVDAA